MFEVPGLKLQCFYFETCCLCCCVVSVQILFYKVQSRFRSSPANDRLADVLHIFISNIPPDCDALVKPQQWPDFSYRMKKKTNAQTYLIFYRTVWQLDKNAVFMQLKKSCTLNIDCTIFLNNVIFCSNNFTLSLSYNNLY